MSVINLESQNIYFAFPDGVLDYDCPSCDALCCRGGGFGGSIHGALGSLLARHPALGLAALSRSGDQVNVATPAGRCFFLTEDRLCRIECDHGPRAKPSVCQLFPFNHFKRFGDIIAIQPHFLCPLKMHEGGLGKGNHDALGRQLQSIGLDANQVATSRMDPDEAQNFIVEERRFLEASTTGLSQGSFKSVLLDQIGDQEDMDHFLGRSLRVMGLDPDVEPSAPHNDFDAQWCAISPSVRLSFHDVSANGRIKALALAYVLSKHIFSIQPASCSLQGLYRFTESTAAKLRLLVGANLPAYTGPGAGEEGTETPTFNQPEFTLTAAITQNLLEAGMDVLSALEQSMPPEWTTADRSAFLVQMGELMKERAKNAAKTP